MIDKEALVNFMILSIETDNKALMANQGLSVGEIEKNISDQKIVVEYLMNSLFDRMNEASVFKENA
jgi:hypothetical protein